MSPRVLNSPNYVLNFTRVLDAPKLYIYKYVMSFKNTHVIDEEHNSTSRAEIVLFTSQNKNVLSYHELELEDLRSVTEY